MSIKTGLIVATIIASSCNGKIEIESPKQQSLSMAGTWQLISGTTIEKGDTVITPYTKDISFIKIINDTHFAFLKDDLKKGKDSSAAFVAGGGRYSLKDSLYTEHLEYCNDRQWEGNDFSFTVTIKNDTLIQSGIEKVETAGINRLNIEKYVRLKSDQEDVTADLFIKDNSSTIKKCNWNKDHTIYYCYQRFYSL